MSNNSAATAMRANSDIFWPINIILFYEVTQNCKRKLHLKFFVYAMIFKDKALIHISIEFLCDRFQNAGKLCNIRRFAKPKSMQAAMDSLYYQLFLNVLGHLSN
jgi:hypothetical protein